MNFKSLRFLIFITFLFPVLPCSGQIPSYTATDKLASLIPDSVAGTTAVLAAYINQNFKTDQEKIRAIYWWTVSRIAYDVENMYAINFNETSEQKIDKALKSRKGVCINYAEVFNDLANKSGIRSYVIDGYNKQNGSATYLPHAWCGARIDGKWLVFDPTWGSGYVQNNKFVARLDNKYFMADPQKIITTHMPFDYLWQFLNYPVTNQEFYLGKTQPDKSKPFFDYEFELNKHEELPQLDKMIAEADRIEKNGVKNSLIFDRLSYKKQSIEIYKQNRMADAFNKATAIFNTGVNEYNDFIAYRNKQFKPEKPDDEILKMIQEPKKKVLEARQILNDLGEVEGPNAANVQNFNKSISDVLTQVEEQETFVNEYLSKSKFGRKSMFTKVTWMGIPLN